MDRVYFDYNATTPLAPEVASAMHGFMEESYGNPSCLHWAGNRARTAIERARGQVATLLHCDPAEVVFTSGGTEANNSTLSGVYFRCLPSPGTRCMLRRASATNCGMCLRRSSRRWIH